MHIKEVEKTEYNKYCTNNINVFNKPEFIETNSSIVDEVKYLIIYKENSARFRACFGIKDDKSANCPFSAPFSYIEPIKEHMGIADYEEAAYALNTCFAQSGIRKATITFPPSFYDERNINSWIQILLRSGWEIDYIDLNFSFCLRHVIDDYEGHLARNARKNLNIAMGADLSIYECTDLIQKKEAYRIIKDNRESKGYVLRMSEEQVQKTMEVVPSKMFIVKCGDENVASALIYDVTDTIAQVIYWGDMPGYSDKKVMNFLAYELVKIYHQRGFEYLDIGPSSDDGLPNYGLCDFKDSIGCERYMKFRLSKKFS